MKWLGRRCGAPVGRALFGFIELGINGAALVRRVLVVGVQKLRAIDLGHRRDDGLAARKREFHK